MQVEQGNLGGDVKSLTPIVFINGRFFGYKMTIGYFQKENSFAKRVICQMIGNSKNYIELSRLERKKYDIVDEILLQIIVY